MGGMCEILTETISINPDEYLTALCGNITRLQLAEISWMSRWLDTRAHSLYASCTDCNKEYPTPSLPCEDLLPASSFCHMLGGDLNCKCSTIAHQCGKEIEIPGFGASMNVTTECTRTCGACGTGARPALFAGYECAVMPLEMAESSESIVGTTKTPMGDGSGSSTTSKMGAKMSAFGTTIASFHLILMLV